MSRGHIRLVEVLGAGRVKGKRKGDKLIKSIINQKRVLVRLWFARKNKVSGVGWVDKAGWQRCKKLCRGKRKGSSN